MLSFTEQSRVLEMTGQKRYKYFIKEVCENETVFGLTDEEGWALLEDDEDGKSVFAVWPHPEFAEKFRQEAGFTDFNVEGIDVMEFLEWLDDFVTDDMKVAVFPTPDFESAVMQPPVLKEDILKVLEAEKE